MADPTVLVADYQSRKAATIKRAIGGVLDHHDLRVLIQRTAEAARVPVSEVALAILDSLEDNAEGGEG